MHKLKICFIGIGSIAKRHIGNLRYICWKRGIQLSIDAYRHSIGGLEAEGIEHTYYSIDNVPCDYDIIFITNPTELHLDSLLKFHEKGRNFFIEKPVVSVSQLEKIKTFRGRIGSIYYVACPLRYNAVIQYIKNNISIEDVISIRSISSSYLPEWRPGLDYRKTYSACRELGGGVSTDLIHEWDYLTYLFGWPKRVSSMLGKKSELEINSDDFAIYIAEFDDQIAELHLDYFGRKTIRQMELYMKNDTVIGDIVNNRVSYLCSGENVIFHEERNDYQKRELEYFLDLVLGNTMPTDFIEHSIRVLKITQGILMNDGNEEREK